ncbi:hypothetical protein C8Q76DRAFT_203323 [Earliella scabrosa]|nr:hypothetical protein C8Q76DRAFT_203323 [Earliella scabrosa]
MSFWTCMSQGPDAEACGSHRRQAPATAAHINRSLHISPPRTLYTASTPEHPTANMEIAATSTLPGGLDVWYHIAAQLDPYAMVSGRKPRPSERAALASLARVCKSLTRPALSVLWRELRDTRPLGLLWCALELRRPSPKPGAPPYTGPRVGPVEYARDHPNLARFREYASLVRGVCFGYEHANYLPRNINIPAGTLEQMQIVLHPDPILPRLHTVETKGRWGGALLHLLSPSIKDMTVLWSDGEGLVPLLRDILPRMPDVERLTVGQWSTNTDAHDMDCLVPLATGLGQNVRHLRAKVADARTLQHIARLPRLETLHLRECKFDALAPNTRFSLPHVHALILEATRLDQLGALFSHVHFPALASLTVQWVPSELPADQLTGELRASLSSIVRTVPGLTALVLSQTAAYPGGALRSGSSSEVNVSFADAFAPALELAGLKTLRIALFDVWITYTADDIRAMAHAWPRLETLRLELAMERRRRRGEAPPTRPTLDALVHFARNCPELNPPDAAADGVRQDGRCERPPRLTRGPRPSPEGAPYTRGCHGCSCRWALERDFELHSGPLPQHSPHSHMG